MTIRLPHILLTVAACLALLPACTGPEADRAMLRAEAMLDSAPDSAAVLLDSVAPLLGRSEARRANHTALTAYARHKADLPLPRRDTLQQAAEHFIINPEPVTPRHVMAFYALGLSCEDDSLFTRSLSAFTRAEDAAQALADHHMLGLIYRHMADIYNDFYHGKEAVHYAKLSLDNFMMANSMEHVKYAILDLAVFYNNACDYEHSAEMAHRLLSPQLFSDIDSYLYTGAKKVLACSAFANQNYDEAIEAYTEIIDIDDTIDVASISNLSIALLKKNQPDKAKYYLDKYIPDSPEYSYAFAAYNAYMGNYAEALNNINFDIERQNHVIHQALNFDTGTEIKAYFKAENKFLSQKVRQHRLIWISVCAIAIILLISIIYYYHISMLKKDKALSDSIIMANELYRKLSDVTNKLKQTESSFSQTKDSLNSTTHNLQKLFENQLNSLSFLCNTIYTHGNSTKQHKEIQNIANEQITTFRNNTEFLEDIVNLTHDQIILKFKSDFPKLVSRDYIHFTYIVLTLSSQAIGVILDMSIDRVYKNKTKIKNIIKQSDSPHKDLYLSYF